MRIAVDAREICGRPAGKGQYLLRILSAWKDGSDTIFCYTYPDQKLPKEVRGNAIRHVPVKGKSLLWHRVVAGQAVADGADVFFAAESYLSVIFNKIPTVTVVHDLAVFVLDDVRHRVKSELVEKLTLRQALKKSAAIIAVSQATADDVVRIGRCPAKKITVIREAPFLVDVAPLPLSKRDGSVLFVGTLEPRKNILNLLRGYAKLKFEEQRAHPLILVGKPGWGKEDYPAAAKALGIAEHCHFKGYLKSEDLVDHFRHARCFVYLSHYEGFGLPVIEAMAAGTPVLTSTAPALVELVADTGLTVKPSDISGITSGLHRLCSDDALAERLSNAVATRATGYTWDSIAAETRTLLASVTNT